MTEPGALNAEHGIPGQLEFKVGPGGLTVAEIANDQGSATIALQGAQVMTWAPRDMAPVIWLPQGARPTPGQIRRVPNTARIAIHPTMTTQIQISAGDWLWPTIQRAAVPRKLASITTFRRKRKSPAPQFRPSVAKETALRGCESAAATQAGKNAAKAVLGTKM